MGLSDSMKSTLIGLALADWYVTWYSIDLLTVFEWVRLSVAIFIPDPAVHDSAMKDCAVEHPVDDFVELCVLHVTAPRREGDGPF